jgi:hypothetical protein
MQMRAARAGLRVLEIPVPYRRRIGGSSKVAGSLSGTIRATGRIIATFVRVARLSHLIEHDARAPSPPEGGEGAQAQMQVARERDA